VKSVRAVLQCKSFSLPRAREFRPLRSNVRTQVFLTQRALRSDTNAVRSKYNHFAIQAGSATRAQPGFSFLRDHARDCRERYLSACKLVGMRGSPEPTLLAGNASAHSTMGHSVEKNRHTRSRASVCRSREGKNGEKKSSKEH